MSVVGNNIATQIGDLSRPLHTRSDRQHQLETVEAREREPEALAEQKVGADDLRSAVAELQQVVEVASGRKLDFGIDDESNDLFVEIRDRASGDLVKQIPSQEVLELRKRLEEMVGLLVHEQA